MESHQYELRESRMRAEFVKLSWKPVSIFLYDPVALPTMQALEKF